MKLDVWTCIFTDNTILNFNPTLLLTHIKFTKAHGQNLPRGGGERLE